MGRRKQTMPFRDAMALVDDDMPDGAFFAMAHELAGLEYGDGFAELADGDDSEQETFQQVQKRKPYKCLACNRRFSDSKALFCHNRDTGHKALNCAGCQKSFGSEQALQQHMTMKHGEQAAVKP